MSVDEFRSIAPDHIIETDFSLHLPVYCDRPRIAQMTSNLLGNALTYGDPNEPVGVHASTGEGVLKLWVANKGTPIPSKAMERFFTRAFQIYEELERSNCAQR